MRWGQSKSDPMWSDPVWSCIFFGPDGGFFESTRNEVYLRTLLYSRSRKGQVIDSMHVTHERSETKQYFSIWVHGGQKGDLYRGRGLFVTHEGVIQNQAPPTRLRISFSGSPATDHAVPLRRRWPIVGSVPSPAGHRPPPGSSSPRPGGVRHRAPPAGWRA